MKLTDEQNGIKFLTVNQTLLVFFGRKSLADSRLRLKMSLHVVPAKIMFSSTHLLMIIRNKDHETKIIFNSMTKSKLKLQVCLSFNRIVFQFRRTIQDWFHFNSWWLKDTTVSDKRQSLIFFLIKQMSRNKRHLESWFTLHGIFVILTQCKCSSWTQVKSVDSINISLTQPLLLTHL